MDAELRRQMHLARELYQHHEYDRAEPLLQAILAQHPGAAELCNMLGVIRHQRGRFAEARRLFEQALAQNPGFTEAALNLAVVLNDTGCYEEGAAIFQRLRAQQGRPAADRAGGRPIRDAFALGRLANLHAATAEGYRELGLFAEAIGEYRRALALCPAFPDLRADLAMTLMEQGDLAGAVEAYRELVALSPRYAQGFVLLGTALYALGRHDEARGAWEQALSLEPENRRLGVYLSWVGGAATLPAPSPLPGAAG